MKKTRAVRVALMLLYFSLSFPAFSQSYNVPKIEDLVKIPPSPEAQAFAKYGNSPVNFYTGSPDISIPIATLRGREIEIPITLTYDASGVKVEQIATWVGLGWNLNVGGMVTRQANGNPDDYLVANPSYFPFYSPVVKPDYDFVNSLSPMENLNYPMGDLKRYFDFMKKIVQEQPTQKYEIQPDTYSFSALGLSGTLFINYNTNTAYCVEHPEVKAVPTFQDTGAIPIRLITGWTITDASGNIFYFNLAEKTYVFEATATDNYKDYYSSWLLTKIESKNKRDVINFNYNTIAEWEQPQLSGRGDMRLDLVTEGTVYGMDQPITSPVPLYKISQSDLSNILINGVPAAQFIPSPTNRLDLNGRKALSEIHVYDQNGAPANRYKLIQSYFGSGTDEKGLRLKLDQVEIHGAGISSNPQKYQFEYSAGGLPHRESFAQDFWGYYNGASNSTLIPYNYDYDKINSATNGFNGANRNPNLNYAQIGTISKITYPTGGTTEFTFNLNQSASETFSYKEDFQVTALSLLGGTDPLDPFGYLACDDATNIPPKGIENSFEITTAGNYEITVTANGTNPGGLQMQFVAVYFGGTGHVPIPRTFCDLLNNPPLPPVKYYPSLLPGFNQTTVAYLQAGQYKIMILNTNPSLTVSVSVTGTQTISRKDAGGLMTQMVLDKDDNGLIASKRYLYYGDLSTVPIENINEAFLTSAYQTSGSLHAIINYEETKYVQKYNGAPQLISYSQLARYSGNRTQAYAQIAYPMATEVQYNANGSGFTGFTVYEFFNDIDSYTGGFSKRTVLNGHVTKKRVYDNNGALINSEQNYYTQNTLGSTVGFYFNSTTQFRKDLFIKSLITSPSNEFFVYQDPTFTINNGSYTEQHCQDGGYSCSIFVADCDDEVKFHNGDILHPNCHSENVDCEQWAAWFFNAYHPANIYYNSLTSEEVPGVVREHHELTQNVSVCRPWYNIIFCYDFGSLHQKVSYLYPRYWATTDSTRSTQYTASGTIETVTKSFYDNNSHFQVTRIETKDSKGVLRKVKVEYPHELQTLYPSDPIWTSLITANRIAEPVRKTATYGASSPDFLQNTVFKTITAGSNTMIVPDYLQFSSGTGPLETRIRYHQYDNVGNPIELSKEGDMRISYLWGYNQLYPVADVRNGSPGTFAYTSFEEGGNSGGWTYTNNPSSTEYKTGSKAQLLTGFSVTRSGLTTSTTYTLSYWAKGGTPTVSAGVTASNDAPAAGTDGWRYFEKTVTGVTSITASSASGTVYLDELRIYPKGSLMTTYTYKPPIGLTNATDPNGQTTYFEYDTYGRLNLVKDFNKKILKQYKYNYRDLSQPGGGTVY